MNASFMHRFLWGLVVVAVGIVFLLNHLGVITMSIGEFFATYWPGFVILFGIQGMLLQTGGAFWWNPLVILIGVLFLGRNLEWFDWDIGDAMQLIWPIVIILIGMSMIFKGSRRSSRRNPNGEQWSPITPPEPPIPPVPPIPPTPPVPPPAPPADGEPFGRPEAPWNEAKREWKESMRGQHGWRQAHERHWQCVQGTRSTHSRFIGDIYFGNDYWELTPMNISHFIGDTTLDLTKAQVPMGETRIQISSFIGDVKVYVPNDMRIGIQVMSSCLIGDVKVLDQKRGGFFNQMSVETPSYHDTEQRVVLVVSSFIGDVRVMKVG